MLRALLILVCLLGLAQAQTFWGTRIDGMVRPAQVPLLGLQAGWESDIGGGGFGLRASVSTILLASRLAVDVYARFPIEPDKSLHLGAGIGYYPFIPCCADASVGTVLNSWHALAGYQWKVGPGQYWFAEITPGVIRRLDGWEFLVVLSLGASLF